MLNKQIAVLLSDAEVVKLVDALRSGRSAQEHRKLVGAIVGGIVVKIKHHCWDA